MAARALLFRHLSVGPNPDAEETGTSGGIIPQTLDPPLLANVNEPAWKRLASRAFHPHEVISLIEAVLTREGEVKVIGNLCGDDAQNFIDVIHEVSSSSLRFQSTV